MKKIIATLLLATAAPFVMAETAPVDSEVVKVSKEAHKQAMKDRFASELELTAEQKEKLSALNEKHKAERDAILTPEQKAKLEQMKQDRFGKKGPKGDREHKGDRDHKAHKKADKKAE